MNDERDVHAQPVLRGSLRVPGDKSASHRALMLSALADGESTIEGLSPGHDVASTAQIMRQLGAQISPQGETVQVLGPRDGLHPSTKPFDCGNSGTTMRLLAGIVSAISGKHELVGDASLSRRPMDRVAVPLRLMGSVVTGSGERVTAPLHITGSSNLQGIAYHLPTSSAQVKSAILLAGLAAAGHTIVTEDVRTRSTTEDMLRHAGIELHSIDHDLGRTVTLTPGRPSPAAWSVPGDPSQAAFFAVLGAVHDDANIQVRSVDTSPERTGFVTVLRRMGAKVQFTGSSESDLRSTSSSLEATEIYSSEIPSVDEVPILSVAAAAANGVSAFRDMGELRVKESDRFAGSMNLAASLGCRVWSEGDDFFIEGLGSARAFSHFTLNAGLDHRMVMSAAVAATAGRGATISGIGTVASSYPHFFDDLASLS